MRRPQLEGKVFICKGMGLPPQYEGSTAVFRNGVTKTYSKPTIRGYIGSIKKGSYSTECGCPFCGATTPVHTSEVTVKGKKCEGCPARHSINGETIIAPPEEN